MKASNTILAQRLAREVEEEATAYQLVGVALDPRADADVRRAATHLIKWIGQRMSGLGSDRTRLQGDGVEETR